MTNIPFALTANEIKEIASLQRIQELWGVQNPADMQRILDDLYTVKFNFMNGSPGYVGDLFIIQPDYLSRDVPVTRLVRNQDKQLEIIE